MDFYLLIKLSRNTIYVWYKIGESKHLPLSFNGDYSFPLAFHLQNNKLVIGELAQEKANTDSNDVYLNYFDLIKDSTKGFEIFGVRYPLSHLICFGIDHIIDYFLKNVYSSHSLKLESIRSKIPLFLWFEPDVELEEQNTVESVLHQFGYNGVLKVNNNLSFIASLSNEKQIEQKSTIVYLNGLKNDLAISLLTPEYKNNTVSVIIKDAGGDAKQKLLAEEIFEYIDTNNPQLYLNRDKEIPGLIIEAEKIIATKTPLAIGKVQTTKGIVCDYYVKINQIEEKLRYINNDQKVITEITRFIDAHNLDYKQITFLLNGNTLNAEYFNERLKQKFLFVYVLTHNFFDCWVNSIFENTAKSILQSKSNQPSNNSIVPENKEIKKDKQNSIPTIGIDLGTTFCCVSYINQEGKPEVITDNRGRITTPSVIWFDGKNAYVGEEANKKKITAFSPIFEFFKRDMGKTYRVKSGEKKRSPYEIEGINYGAIGMSAILLRKLKRDAWQFFKKKKIIDQSIKESEFSVDAIITVPAYFGEEARMATKYAGTLAGLNVVATINEPTAASLTYGVSTGDNKQILVFDLGGGTLDVTVLQVVSGGFFKVIASDGNTELGGKDWDDIIIKYFEEKFSEETGTEFPMERLFDLQQLAIQSKKDLSDNTETIVYLSANGFDIELPLYRSASESGDLNGQFFFDEKCKDLTTRCLERCSTVLKSSSLNWNDIDEIVLAGGSCRMPMIKQLLEKASNKKIETNHLNFDFDTAISFGASILGQKSEKIIDVTSKSVGIKLVNQQQKEFIDHLIVKNSALPAKIRKKYLADPFAKLEIFEGESKDPNECIQLGTLELENTCDSVVIIIEIDKNGILKVLADYQPEGTKETKIKGSSQFPVELMDKIQNITITC